MEPAQLNHGQQSPRRGAARLRLHLPAQLVLVSGRTSCLVENISVSGAQLIVKHAPQIGAMGQLRCEGLEAYFLAVWTAGNLLGVEFDEAISLQDVLRLRKINDAHSELQRQEIRRDARRWVNGELS